VAGTTLTGVVQVRRHGEAQWLVLNVGDSRVYEWDDRGLTQLTLDHSAVQELLDAGLISPAEALVHPERNVITRALGADDDVDVDVWLLPATGARTFLVCSDGLTKELDDTQIVAIVDEHGDALASGDDASAPSAVADALVDAALDAGGRDNVTVIVVRSLASSQPGQW
jgi:serine/threonine protein phosphatase PrpC